MSTVLAKDLILRKVNVDLDVVESNHFEVNVNDEETEKLVDWQVVSVYWPKQPEDGYLQVAVNSITSCFEIQLCHFCTEYWGKGDEGRKVIYHEAKINVPESDDDMSPASSRNGPAATSYRYISLGPDFQLFGREVKSMLVRKEYNEVMDFLSGLFGGGGRGAVVLGQPGIGKTAFLHFMLIERILEAKPTVFQKAPNEIFSIDGSGRLKVFRRGGLLDPSGHSGVWALVDSNADLVLPDHVFTGSHSSFFLVQATSFQSGQWKGWRKYLGAKVVAMKSWSWDEIYIAGTQLSQMEYRVEVLQDVFEKYGGSAGHCFDLARMPIKADNWEASIPGLLKSLPDLNAIVVAVKTGKEVLSKPFFQIITFVPGDYRQPLVTMVSRHITSHLFETILKNDQSQFWSYFDHFSGHPQTRDSAGWLWEHHILRLIISQGQFTISCMPLTPSARTHQPPADPFDVIVEYNNDIRKNSNTYIPQHILCSNS